jgi:hypothetical protein
MCAHDRDADDVIRVARALLGADSFVGARRALPRIPAAFPQAARLAESEVPATAEFAATDRPKET